MLRFEHDAWNDGSHELTKHINMHYKDWRIPSEADLTPQLASNTAVSEDSGKKEETQTVLVGLPVEADKPELLYAAEPVTGVP